jgi:flagellar protein FlgJ
MNVNGLKPLNAVSTATAPEKLDKVHSDLKKATQQFESYFVDQMLKEMRKGIPKDDLFGDSDNQQAIFQDMSDQAVADSVSKRGNFGIANMLYKELSKTLPTNNPPQDASANTVAAPSTIDAKDVKETHR